MHGLDIDMIVCGSRLLVIENYKMQYYNIIRQSF